MSMATEFPHVYFCSADVVPIISHTQRPNVTFEAYDFTGPDARGSDYQSRRGDG
ncbi:methyltransferase domain protein [Ceratobasidium sp. AG-Ba]|nr:methyltransferase domain protein [Ceratobasidium sp. AG-Ba]